jgi:acetolactate synthase-1/2/3 large subunit
MWGTMRQRKRGELTEIQKRTASQAIVEALDREGVEFVFGLTGTHVLPIFDALADCKRIRHVTVKHESAAAYMASTYGYLTGRPGVALVTAGPGATNSLSGVAQAFAASHPMVHITGTVPIGSTNEPFHGVDRDDFLQRVFAPVTKSSVRIDRPEEIPGILSGAFSLAASGRPGPVHVEIPENLLRSEVQISDPYLPSPVERIKPAPSMLDAIAAQLRQAKRPMIVAGRGVIIRHAERGLVQLAEAVAAPVLTTIYGDGAIPDDHPLALGIFDEWWGNSLAWELMAESDLLLALGLRSGTLLTEELAKHAPREAQFVALDEPETLRPVAWAHSVHIIDLAYLFEGLLARRRRFARPGEESVLNRIREYKQTLRIGLNAQLRQFEGMKPLHFGCVLQELAVNLAEDAVVLSGWGNNRFWGRAVMPVHKRDSYIGDASWGTMGFELSGGITAKLVYPHRPSVVITGDGALLMALGDFVTAVENEAHILVVVMNDSRYGNIWQLQMMEFERTYGDRIGRVDFARLAENMGGKGVRLEEPGEIRRAVREALELSDGDAVILDVVCDHQFGWPEIEEMLALGKRLRQTQR